MLQTIDANGVSVNSCYDSACRGSVIKKSCVDAFDKLGRAECHRPGPLTLFGVGDKTTICEHGEWSITIPLKDGKNVRIRGMVLDKVTSTFPEFELGRIEQDIQKNYAKPSP